MSLADPQRLFVAFYFDPDTGAALQRSVAEALKGLKQASLSPPEAYHLTLVSLGHVEAAHMTDALRLIDRWFLRRPRITPWRSVSCEAVASPKQTYLVTKVGLNDPAVWQASVQVLRGQLDPYAPKRDRSVWTPQIVVGKLLDQNRANLVAKLPLTYLTPTRLCLVGVDSDAAHTHRTMHELPIVSL